MWPSPCEDVDRETCAEQIEALLLAGDPKVQAIRETARQVAMYLEFERYRVSTPLNSATRRLLELLNEVGLAGRVEED